MLLRLANPHFTTLAKAHLNPNSTRVYRGMSSAEYHDWHEKGRIPKGKHTVDHSSVGWAHDHHNFGGNDIMVSFRAPREHLRQGDTGKGHWMTHQDIPIKEGDVAVEAGDLKPKHEIAAAKEIRNAAGKSEIQKAKDALHPGRTFHDYGQRHTVVGRRGQRYHIKSEWLSPDHHPDVKKAAAQMDRHIDEVKHMGQWNELGRHNPAARDNAGHREYTNEDFKPHLEAYEKARQEHEGAVERAKSEPAQEWHPTLRNIAARHSSYISVFHTPEESYDHETQLDLRALRNHYFNKERPMHKGLLLRFVSGVGRVLRLTKSVEGDEHPAIQRAIDAFGTTHDPEKAAYVTPGGKLIQHGDTGLHAEVASVALNRSHDEGNRLNQHHAADFCSETGCIRHINMDGTHVEIHHPVTPAQKQAILKMHTRGEPFHADIGSPRRYALGREVALHSHVGAALDKANEILQGTSLHKSHDVSTEPRLPKGGKGGGEWTKGGGRPPSDPAVREEGNKRELDQPIPPTTWGLSLHPDPTALRQATYYDERGRQQVRYHKRALAQRADKKFGAMPHFMQALPQIRKRVAADLKLDDAALNRACAAIVELMDQTTMRVGGEAYVEENGTFGASSLRKHQVEVKGRTVRCRFTGKEHVEHDKVAQSPALAAAVKHFLALPGERLFQFHPDGGGLAPVTEDRVQKYLASFGVTPKQFRTYHGTRLATEFLQHLGPPTDEKAARAGIVAACKAVSDLLGNSPAMARASYIDPVVFEAYLHSTKRGEI